jgi:hypothetical protein
MSECRNRLDLPVGDPVYLEIDGARSPGKYEGFAPGAGHVVRTERTVVVVREPARIRKGD